MAGYSMYWVDLGVFRVLQDWHVKVMLEGVMVFGVKVMEGLGMAL